MCASVSYVEAMGKHPHLGKPCEFCGELREFGSTKRRDEARLIEGGHRHRKCMKTAGKIILASTEAADEYGQQTVSSVHSPPLTVPCAQAATFPVLRRRKLQPVSGKLRGCRKPRRRTCWRVRRWRPNQLCARYALCTHHHLPCPALKLQLSLSFAGGNNIRPL